MPERSAERIRAHYEVERELAARLRRAGARRPLRVPHAGAADRPARHLLALRRRGHLLEPQGVLDRGAPPPPWRRGVRAREGARQGALPRPRAAHRTAGLIERALFVLPGRRGRRLARRLPIRKVLRRVVAEKA